MIEDKKKRGGVPSFFTIFSDKINKADVSIVPP
ncbi:hypothetical protein SAMN05216331_109106 [Porphyromonadaceae bacterium KH3R12]|nr:hypothetical protein SAMN05216331_109106 [Porphyromonadaceae bacterium KH3R12]